jgi:hypothetical protein
MAYFHRKGDNIYFLYDEHKDNIAKTSLYDMKMIPPYSNTGIAIAKVELATGKTSRSMLIGPDNKLQQYALGVVKSISEDYVSVFYWTGKKSTQGIFKVE